MTTAIARAHRARRPLTSTLILIAGASAAAACDLCSTPSAPDTGPGWSIGLYQQYSHFGTLRDDGDKVGNEVGQYLDSSVTQLVAGYRFSERCSAQVIVPYIHRAFKRPEGFEIDRGIEQGIGDVTVLGSVRVLRIDGESTVVRVDDSIGIEMPTGRSGRLAEEADETAVPGAPESGVHGHDLALGSGSWDIPLGIDVFARDRSAYLGAHAQYTIRNRGTHRYQYANDLVWNVTPGFDVWRSGPSRLGLEANFSGEAKGKDISDGEVAEDTGMVSVYLGPQITCAWRRQLSAVAGVDLPLLQHDTSLQLVPDYRLHAGVTWAF